MPWIMPSAWPMLSKNANILQSMFCCGLQNQAAHYFSQSVIKHLGELEAWIYTVSPAKNNPK